MKRELMGDQNRFNPQRGGQRPAAIARWAERTSQRALDLSGWSGSIRMGLAWAAISAAS